MSEARPRRERQRKDIPAFQFWIIFALLVFAYGVFWGGLILALWVIWGATGARIALGGILGLHCLILVGINAFFLILWLANNRPARWEADEP